MTTNLEKKIFEKNRNFVVTHKSKDFCGDLLAPCWEIKEGGECEPGVYPYIDYLTFCGSHLSPIPASLVHGCLDYHHCF